MIIKALIKPVFAFACVLLFVSHLNAQQPQKTPDDTNQQAAVATVRHYLMLRLNNAKWKEYSKFITWPDEPAWDCKWVVCNYSIGKSNKKGNKIIVPVVFTRLGLFCNNMYFEPAPREVIIKYQLEKHSGGWKVSGPDIDYPEIGANIVMKSLNTLAANASETAELCGRAEVMARKINSACNKR